MCRQASCILGHGQPAEGMISGSPLFCGLAANLTGIYSFSLQILSMRIQPYIKFSRMYVVSVQELGIRGLIRAWIGEKQTEAFHQSHTLGELYFAGCAGRSGKRHAEYVYSYIPQACLFCAVADLQQTNIPRGIQVQDTMAGMSSSTNPRGYVKLELYRPLG